MKRHATDDVDPVTHTLCGIDIDGYGYRSEPKGFVDNAHPDCKRCLRVIRARLERGAN